jgi:predicted lipoprotein with Yx(FWY)xxD motif
MRDSMSKAAAARSRAVQVVLLAGLVAVFAVAALVLLTRGSSAAPTAQSTVVATAKNAKLGTTILVNRRGLSLYNLSVERRGRFICTTKFCLSLWHPLVVPRGTTPAGVRLLGTVRRPDGRRQVTYRGAPLYTFTQDHKRGDVNGNGFKDVGIWHPTALSGSASGSGTTTGGSGSGGYGGY